MKVKVMLHGTLRKRCPGYEKPGGTEIDIARKTTVKELLVLLGIDEVKGTAVILRGRIQKETDTIPPGATISVVQTVHGG